MFNLDDPLRRRLQVLFSVAGAVMLLAGVILAFLALAIAGGGHAWPFSGSTEDAMFASSLLSVPATMIAMGLALVRPNAARVKIAARLALLIPLDAAFIAAVVWHQSRPEPPLSIPPGDPHAVITGVVIQPLPQPPRPLLADCPARDGCAQPSPRPVGSSELVSAQTAVIPEDRELKKPARSR